MAGKVAADCPEADYAERESRQFLRTGIFLPDNLLSPEAPFLKSHCLRNPLGQSEDHAHGLLGDGRPMYVAAVGKEDVAIHELGKQKLMNRSGG